MTKIGKKLAAVFLAVVMAITFVPVLGTQTVNAETFSKHFTVGDFEFYESDVTDSYNSTYDGGVGVSLYTGADTDVTVPRAVYYDDDYYCVTVIGEEAFKGTDVTSVVIPDSVRYIERLAFSECADLKDLYVNGKNVTCNDHSIGWAYDVQEDIYTRETNPVTIHGFQGTGLHTYAAANGFAWEDVHVITSVKLNGITRPIAGEMPTKEGITSPDNSGYSFYPAASGWYNESNGNWQGNNVFESGKEYSMNAWIYPEPGYVFAEDFQSIEVERPEYVSRVTLSRGGTGVTYLVVIYEYYATQGPSTDIPISEINITYDTDAVSHSSGKTEGETYDLLYAEGGVQVAADQGTVSSGRAFLYENNNNGNRSRVEGSTDLMTLEKRYDIYVDSIKLGSGYCFPDSVKAHTGAFTGIGSPADFKFKVNGAVREDVEIKYESGILYAWVPISKSIEDATVTGISDIIYTGEEVSVSPTVIVDGIMLTDGPRADYTVLYYGDRKNVGSVRVELVGLGNYYGRINKEFKIIPADLASVTFPTITEQKYSGKALTPSLKPTYNGTELVKDVDYTAVYSNNTNVGTATVIITGKGNYTGSVEKTFTVTAKTITPDVTLSASSYTWNGKDKKPSVIIKDGSTKLAASDYTVTYKNNKNVGKASAVVKLNGNYSGTKTVTFKINPKGTSLSKVTAAKKAATVKWKKQSSKMSSSRITGYQIQLATNSKFTKNKKTVTVKGYSKTSKKVTKLKGGKKYYVKIRTYKTVGGIKYYSPWSKVKTVTTKK